MLYAGPCRQGVPPGGRTHVRRITADCDWSPSGHRQSRDRHADQWRKCHGAVPTARTTVTGLRGVHNRCQHEASCDEFSGFVGRLCSREFCRAVQRHA